LADQRPIVRSEPVIPLEIAEFDCDGLADVCQWAKLEAEIAWAKERALAQEQFEKDWYAAQATQSASQG
jgi:hypothetical protein